MRKKVSTPWRCLAAAGLSLCCAAGLAVPKAAEHEDAPVSFGEAAPPPKPTSKTTSKLATPAATQTAARSPAARKPNSAATRAAQPQATAKARATTKPAVNSPAKPRGTARKK